MYGFIYITTNHINGKKYLGQRKYDSNGKWKSYLGSGKLLKLAIKKYGRENFTKEILVEARTREEMSSLEEHYINLYKCRESENWYNIFKGGYGGSLKGEESQNFGRVQTDDHKQKIKSGMRARYHNPFYKYDIITKEKEFFNNNREYLDKYGRRVPFKPSDSFEEAKLYKKRYLFLKSSVFS